MSEATNKVQQTAKLNSGTESAARCGGTISDLFPVVTGVCQGCVLAPTLFSACMDWILERMSERSSDGASFGNVKITDTLISQVEQSSLWRLWISFWGPLRC